MGKAIRFVRGILIVSQSLFKRSKDPKLRKSINESIWCRPTLQPPSSCGSFANGLTCPPREPSSSSSTEWSPSQAGQWESCMASTRIRMASCTLLTRAKTPSVFNNNIKLTHYKNTHIPPFKDFLKNTTFSEKCCFFHSVYKHFL